MVAVRKFKNVDYVALPMHTGSLKINNFKVLFWEVESGSQKRVLCTLLIMLTIMDDALGWYIMNNRERLQIGWC